MKDKVFWMTLLASLCLCGTVLHAGQMELTTYYPAPEGDYNELKSNNINTNKLALGDTNQDTVRDAADLPSRDGDIRLMPQAGDPEEWDAGEIGQVAYSSANDSLFLYNGSQWVGAVGGGVQRIVKVSANTTSSISVSCGSGKIIKCCCNQSGDAWGVTNVDAMENRVLKAFLGNYDPEYSSRYQCPWSCYGLSSCSVPATTSANPKAIIVLCSE